MAADTGERRDSEASALADARWAGEVGAWGTISRGLFDCISIPGLILLSSSAGFGALARDAGFSLTNATFMMAAFYALPAQVVMVDQLARGASIWAGAFSVLLTAIRMIPMVVSIMPLIRARPSQRWLQVMAVHGVAVTGWIEGMRRLPAVPEDKRVVYYAGLAWGLVGVTVLGTIIGFEAAGSLPPIIAAVLLFLTPIYFLLSMMATVRAGSADALSIAFGCALGPAFYVMTPGLDLLLTAVVGGGAAYLIGRRRNGGARGPRKVG